MRTMIDDHAGDDVVDIVLLGATRINIHSLSGQNDLNSVSDCDVVLTNLQEIIRTQLFAHSHISREVY